MKNDFVKENKLTPEDLPIIICGISGRPTPKREATFQRGYWVRKEYADKLRRLVVPKEDM